LLSTFRPGALPKLISFALPASATPLNDAEHTKPPGMASTSMPKVGSRRSLARMWWGTTGRSFTTESAPLPWIRRTRTTTPALLRSTNSFGTDSARPRRYVAERRGAQLQRPDAPFISDAQLETQLQEVGVPVDLQDDIIAQNEEAQIEGLRTALAVLTVMGVIALSFTGRTPRLQPGSEPSSEPESESGSESAPAQERPAAAPHRPTSQGQARPAGHRVRDEHLEGIRDTVRTQRR
jgi:hypothetical protein